MLEKYKNIIILLVLAIVAYFLFFRKKKTVEETIKEGVSGTLLRSASESVRAVELSEEDEEYNLLRQEYSDRYGEAAKSSWTKSMIQQKIDEYDERSKYLDLLVEVSGEDKLEEASNMNSEEILRMIETEKQRKAQELDTARVAYKEATGENVDHTLGTSAIYALIAEKLAAAKNEYVDFTGEPAPASCTTAKAVQNALANKKEQMKKDWSARKNHILSMAALVADKLKNRGIVAVKREIEAALNEVYAYDDREFYVWFSTCYNKITSENRDFYGEFKHLNTSILFWDSLQKVAGAILLRHENNYRELQIDEYGRVTN
ncbi:MAG: hypothetical protein U0K53_02390 [Paludibacteraceae bacterium]|nr:hypothetical protein [Paludibacteraceae bacterium]